MWHPILRKRKEKKKIPGAGRTSATWMEAERNEEGGRATGAERREGYSTDLTDLPHER